MAKQLYPVPEAVARGFLEALRSEYVQGKFEGVRLFYEGENPVPGDQQVSLDPFEDRIKHADGKKEAIIRLTREWKLNTPPVPLDVADGFLKALWNEYINGTFEAVRLFYEGEKPVPGHQQVALDPYEFRIKAEEDKKQAILELAFEWRVCPVPAPIARGFLEALRSEYDRGVFEGVRLYYEGETPVPGHHQVALDPYEEYVRGSEDKLEAVRELTEYWRLDCPPVRASTAKGFLKALRSEYIKGTYEAVRIFYETGIPGHEQVALDPYEARIRQAEDQREAILDVYCEWHLDFPPVPLATARGFLQAAREEYLEGTFEAVRLFYETGIPCVEQVTLDPYEQRIREGEDKAEELAEIAAEWNLECPPVRLETAKGFIQALRDEYLRGVFEAVRLFYEGENPVPDDEQVCLDPFEARVRDAGDKLPAIVELLEEWNMDCPPVPGKTARGFIKALKAEQLHGDFGAVGRYYDLGIPDHEQVTLDPYEAEVKAAEDKAAAINELVAVWGL